MHPPRRTGAVGVVVSIANAEGPVVATRDDPDGLLMKENSSKHFGDQTMDLAPVPASEEGLFLERVRRG
ncbi:hypothetical protein [Corynebacterium cystitidis]|uniref:hypothetical protein n=2 Tax=Corynebacterium cystitidis TaxID=35757 RepID=UPI00211E86B1|nr:hypothetical protein [Corynebacterium cystitidis]